MAAGATPPSQPPFSCTWKSDFDAHALVGNLRRRGWQEAESLGIAGIVWCGAAGPTAALVFGPDTPVALRPGQLINHFPGSGNLSRKDLLLQHVASYSRRWAHALAGRGTTAAFPASSCGTPSLPTVLPPTYSLPQDYAQYAAHFRRLAAAGVEGCWVLEPHSAASAADTARVATGPAAAGKPAATSAAARPAAGAQTSEGVLIIRPLHVLRGASGRSEVPVQQQQEQEEPPKGGTPAVTKNNTNSVAGGNASTSLPTAAAPPPAATATAAASTKPSSPTGGLLQLMMSSTSLEGSTPAPQRLVWWRAAPLRLGGGCRVELRLYALVASTSPLLAYLSTQGFARLRGEDPRTPEATEQLEGWAVRVTHCKGPAGGSGQGRGAQAPSSASGRQKWGLEDLRLHLEATRGHAATEGLFAALRVLVLQTLLAVAPAMGVGRNSFELLGFDVALDDRLVPSLVRIKVDPSLAAATKADRLFKFRLMSDVLDAVAPASSGRAGDTQQAPAAASGTVAGATGAAKGAATAGQQKDKLRPPVSYAAGACGGRERIGALELLYDERQDPAWQQAQQVKAEAKAKAEREAARAARRPLSGLTAVDRAPAAAQKAASPAKQRALLAAGKPRLVEPTKKIVLR